MKKFVTFGKAQRDTDSIRSFKCYIVSQDAQTFCRYFTGNKNRLYCKDKCVFYRPIILLYCEGYWENVNTVCGKMQSLKSE